MIRKCMDKSSIVFSTYCLEERSKMPGGEEFCKVPCAEPASQQSRLSQQPLLFQPTYKTPVLPLHRAGLRRQALEEFAGHEKSDKKPGGFEEDIHDVMTELELAKDQLAKVRLSAHARLW